MNRNLLRRALALAQSLMQGENAASARMHPIADGVAILVGLLEQVAVDLDLPTNTWRAYFIASGSLREYAENRGGGIAGDVLPELQRVLIEALSRADPRPSSRFPFIESDALRAVLESDYLEAESSLESGALQDPVWAVLRDAG